MIKPRRDARRAPTAIMMGPHRDQKPLKFTGPAPATAPPWELTAGACAQPGSDPDTWFNPDTETQAIAVCESCPVIAACRDWAAAVRPAFGIWAGMTPQQRIDQRRREQRRKEAS